MILSLHGHLNCFHLFSQRVTFLILAQIQGLLFVCVCFYTHIACQQMNRVLMNRLYHNDPSMMDPTAWLVRKNVNSGFPVTTEKTVHGVLLQYTVLAFPSNHKGNTARSRPTALPGIRRPRKMYTRGCKSRDHILGIYLIGRGETNQACNVRTCSPMAWR